MHFARNGEDLAAARREMHFRHRFQMRREMHLPTPISVSIPGTD
jgi:hypothetical protein